MQAVYCKTSNVLPVAGKRHIDELLYPTVSIHPTE